MKTLSSVGRLKSLQPTMVIGTSHTPAHGQLFCGYAFELINKEGAVIGSGHSYPKILKGDHTKAVLPAIIHAMELLHDPENIVVVNQLEYQISALNQRSLGPANTNYKRSGGKRFLADHLALRELDEALAKSGHKITARYPRTLDEVARYDRLTDSAHECAKAAADFMSNAG